MDKKMIRSTVFNEWHKFVYDMHELLPSATWVRTRFVITFCCSICRRNHLTVRTSPCYHVYCPQCKPRPACCSKDCGNVLLEPSSRLIQFVTPDENKDCEKLTL